MEENKVNETTLHYFDLENAERYGILEAVILQHFQFWIQKNEACNKHYHDGRYWTYGSIKELHKIFWYVSEEQIKHAIKNLKSKGAIVTGEFNKTPYDRTTWYGVSNVANDNIELGKIPNRVEKNPQPIPYIETDIETDNVKRELLPIGRNSPKGESSEVQEVVDTYNVTCPSLPRVCKITDTRKRHIKARLKEHSFDEIKQVFLIAEQSDFLSGRKSDWQADFDWLTKGETNFMKVLEGNYSNRDFKKEKYVSDLKKITDGMTQEEFEEVDRLFR